ncbi:MAG: ABC transporter permease, partial [Chlamydiia bacterium]|nr:ABC transporter permease [Chlamydiia bacterium]
MKMLISQFLRRPLGLASLFVILLFCVVAVYAPFLASGKPIAVYYDGSLYFPLFRYLLYPGYYTKPIDLFFNALIFTLPILLFWRRRWAFPLFCTLQLALFLWALLGTHKDPALDLELLAKRRTLLQEDAKNRSHSFEIAMMSPYQKLNKVMQYRRDLQSHENVVRYLKSKTAASTRLETLKSSEEDKRWLDRENAKVGWVLWPLIRTYHWEEYAGGSQAMNQDVPWWELTRLNRKDFTAALIFGVRVSLVVGIIAVAIALLIGVPVGCIAGFYGGKIDILLCRLIEVWESMPTFFMLLFVVAILQSKSIFLV